MKENSRYKPAAILWDESFLWGVMAYKALSEAGLPFDLLKAEDVRNGRLEPYALLFVPGGWASNKVKALGNDGVEAIKQFVHDGGSYLGFCGGAGLATADGLGLVPVKRRMTKDRVPSFSGRIGLQTTEHRIWDGLNNSELPTPNSPLIFHAWWPSQFVVAEGVNVLATYGEAMSDAFSSDVNVGDAEVSGGWEELEDRYRINLDPKRLLGEPAVIEGTYGKGKVLLSLVHFDTPGDASGAAVLSNLWDYLVSSGEAAALSHARSGCMRKPDRAGSELPTLNTELIDRLESPIEELISLGKRNFLWFQRTPLLLQWRRGVRGLEYCTLSVMIKEISMKVKEGFIPDPASFASDVERIGKVLIPFAEKAKRLLVLERCAMGNGHITYERCDDPEIQSLREELFSKSKSYGGMFKKLIDEMDGLLFRMLKS